MIIVPAFLLFSCCKKNKNNINLNKFTYDDKEYTDFVNCGVEGITTKKFISFYIANNLKTPISVSILDTNLKIISYNYFMYFEKNNTGPQSVNLYPCGDVICKYYSDTIRALSSKKYNLIIETDSLFNLYWKSNNHLKLSFCSFHIYSSEPLMSPFVLEYRKNFNEISNDTTFISTILPILEVNKSGKNVNITLLSIGKETTHIGFKAFKKI
jgi:hypothetical protein